MKRSLFKLSVLPLYTLSLLFIIALSAMPASAQSSSRVSKLNNKIEINAPVESVWAILGNLSGCNSWIPGIVSAKVEGDKRICTTADNNIIIEKISEYSARKKSFKYIHLQSPMPVKNSKGVFKVIGNKNLTIVYWDATFEVIDYTQKASITKMINGYYLQSLESLKKLVESR